MTLKFTVLILTSLVCTGLIGKEVPNVPPPAVSEGRSIWSKEVTLVEIEKKIAEESKVEIDGGEAVTLKVFESVELPSAEEFKELKRRKKKDDAIWFFDGLDKGYAILRKGKVVWHVFTDHEY